MKSLGRTPIVLLGGFLLHAAFLVKSRDMLMTFLPPVPLVAPMIAAAFGAFLCFACARHWATDLPVQAGVAAALLWWLCPLQNDPRLMVSAWDTLRAALWALAGLSAWLAMDTWSVFMRSMVLMPWVAFGFLFVGPAVPAALTALAVWALFNRRRWSAIGSFLFLSVVGWLCSEIARGIYDLVARQGWNLAAMAEGWVARYHAWAAVPVWSLSVESSLRLGRAASQVSIPFLILSGWSVGSRIGAMVAQRRSDAGAFAALLAMAALLTMLGRPHAPQYDVMWLMLFTACAIPLTAVDLACKELLLSRAARQVAGVGLVFGAAVTLVTAAAGRAQETMPMNSVVWTVAALGAAWLVSSWIVRVDWLKNEYRLRAVLAGATVGAWVASQLNLFHS